MGELVDEHLQEREEGVGRWPLGRRGREESNQKRAKEEEIKADPLDAGEGGKRAELVACLEEVLTGKPKEEFQFFAPTFDEREERRLGSVLKERGAREVSSREKQRGGAWSKGGGEVARLVLVSSFPFPSSTIRRHPVEHLRTRQQIRPIRRVRHGVWPVRKRPEEGESSEEGKSERRGREVSVAGESIEEEKSSPVEGKLLRLG